MFFFFWSHLGGKGLKHKIKMKAIVSHNKENFLWELTELFSIECCKTEAEVSTMANQKRVKCPEKPMGTQNKNSRTA